MFSSAVFSLSPIGRREFWLFFLVFAILDAVGIAIVMSVPHVFSPEVGKAGLWLLYAALAVLAFAGVRRLRDLSPAAMIGLILFAASVLFLMMTSGVQKNAPGFLLLIILLGVWRSAKKPQATTP